MNVTKKNVLYFVRIIGVLLVITMCVAALLSLVNEVTKDKIAKNDEKTLDAAVKSIFVNVSDPKTEKLTVALDDKTFNGLYAVKNGDTLAGYYAEVAPKGFKGAVEMLIGIGLDGTVCGIEIVSSGETPGIGDKIEKNSFLNKFKGKNASTLDVDTISGATYSSKAVINGTKTALKAYEKYIGEGK